MWWRNVQEEIRAQSRAGAFLAVLAPQKFIKGKIMGIRVEDFVPIMGMMNGKGMFGDMLGKKSENEAKEQAAAKAAADQKAAQEQAAAQANAQQWANSRTTMKKGGMAKKMADGGKVPQDVDGASATRSPKKGEKPVYEEPGSGIRVDGKPLNKAKGGMVGSSASRRADGMASRGKTRGKMC